MGAAGQTWKRISRLDTIAVGRAERCQLPVLVADIFAALSEDVGARVEGVLGYPYLQAYQVTLDYRAGIAIETHERRAQRPPAPGAGGTPNTEDADTIFFDAHCANGGGSTGRAGGFPRLSDPGLRLSSWDRRPIWDLSAPAGAGGTRLLSSDAEP